MDGDDATGAGGDGTRDHGEQPIAARMRARGLAGRDLVASSEDQLTHRTVARAMKGRQLTPRAVGKVLAAYNRASGESARPDELFSYVTARGRIAR